MGLCAGAACDCFPADRPGCCGWGDRRFEVEVASELPLLFEWKREGISIPGANSRALVLSNIQADDEGDYSVMVRNPDGTVHSAPARLTPARQPLAVRVEGSSILLSWDGAFRLQTATEVAGPYVNVDDAESPFESV